MPVACLGSEAVAALTSQGASTVIARSRQRPYAVGRELAAVRQATAKYHDVQAALDDGFAATDECVPGMGFHYARMDRVVDGVVNPLEPEVLIYAPQEDGKRRLVAVEYVVVTNAPAHQFDLHASIWLGNPDGVFTAHNPTSMCQ
jgi:hypothetical protein